LALAPDPQGRQRRSGDPVAQTLAERPDVAARLRAGAAGLLARQHGRFAPWLAVALGAGVLLYFQQPTEPGPGGLILAVPLIGLAMLVSRRAPLSGWVLALAAAGCLGFGIAAWHAARMPPPLELPRWAVPITGEVAAVEALPEGQRVTLRRVRIAGAEPLPRDIRLRLRESDPARPMPGDLLSARALLREPGGPVVPGGWDFARAAYFSGLGGSGTALGPVEVTRAAGELPPFARLRAQLEAKVGAAIPGVAGAVAAALLTGSQAAIPPAEIVAMRDSGLAHLLSVSGLHMTIVMGAVFGVLRLLVALVPWLALRVNGKAVAAVGALLAGLGYTLLTGAQVPMQRCLVMAALVTLGLLAGRRALTVRSLALAAAAVLLVAPAEALGPSFQMSFAAVLALAAGWESLRGRLPAGGSGWRRKLILAAFGLMVTSVLAGAATAPIGLHHFGRLQIYGVAANALAVPITSVLVMPAGMIALLLMPFGLEGPALWAMGQGVAAILAVAAWVAAWPEAAPVLAPLPGPALAVMGFGFCWLALWRGALRLVGVPVMLGAVVASVQVPPPVVLVTGDARVVALRTAEGVFLHAQHGASAFARNAVLRQMGAEAGLPLPASGEAAGGAIACTPVACRFRPQPDGPEIVLFRTAAPARGARGGAPPDPAVLEEACGRAVLLVATEPIRRRCPGSAVIDRFTVWREGSQAVRLSPGGLTVLSERALRGDRPWVPPPPLPGRPDPQPVAPRDPGE
jgi:competence protein ComEC